MSHESKVVLEPQTTLADAFRETVKKLPNKVGLVHFDRDLKSEEITYAQFDVQVRRLAAGLRKEGLVPGDKVLFQMTSLKYSVLGFWACVVGGFVAVPLPLPSSFTFASASLTKLQTACNLMSEKPYVLADASHNQILDLKDNKNFSFPSNLRVGDLMTLSLTEPEEVKYKPKPSDHAAYMLTSGSTGNSKAVVHTHHTILAGVYTKSVQLKFDQSLVGINWVPGDHVASVFDANVVQLVNGGVQSHINANAVLDNPVRLLQAAQKVGATQCFMPNFFIGLINGAISKTAAYHEDINLSKLRCIQSGGEAIVVKTAKTCLDLLCTRFSLPRNAIAPGFGMTEIGAGTIFNLEFPTPADEKMEFAALGYPMPGMHMRTCYESNGEVTQPGEVGELQLKSEAVFVEYYKNPAETKKAFTSDGWFRTGDLARIVNGSLQLQGRNKDTIIVNGSNYYSHEIEALVERLEGIDTGFTAACAVRVPGFDTEQLVIFFYAWRAAADDGILYKTYVLVRDTTVQYMGVRPHAIILLKPEEIPKTSLGKIERRKLRLAFEEGKYKAKVDHILGIIKKNAAAMVPPETKYENEIVNLWGKVLSIPVEDISVLISFFDIGGTSIDTIALKTVLDEHFHYDVPAVWIFQYPTVREFAVVLQKKLEMKRGPDGKIPTEVANKMYDPIVRFHEDGEKGKEPFFIVHTGAGDVLAYVELSKRFKGDRAFYGIRTRGFDEGETLFENFREMVRSYVDGIRRIQPNGPYFIAGYSFGSPVAYDICKMLEHEDKQHVAFCGVFDSPPQLRGFGNIHPLKMHVYLAVYLGLFPKSQFQKLLAQLEECEFERDWIPTLLKSANPKRVEELKMTVAGFQSFCTVGYRFQRLGFSHRTNGLINTLQVFSCYQGEPMMIPSPEWRRRQREWGRYSVNTHFYNVLGEHETLLDVDNVGKFAVILKQSIAICAELARNRDAAPPAANELIFNEMKRNEPYYEALTAKSDEEEDVRRLEFVQQRKKKVMQLRKARLEREAKEGKAPPPASEDPFAGTGIWEKVGFDGVLTGMDTTEEGADEKKGAAKRGRERKEAKGAEDDADDAGDDENGNGHAGSPSKKKGKAKKPAKKKQKKAAS